MRLRRSIAVVLLGVGTVAAAGVSQRGGFGGPGFRRPGPNSFNGTFTFCRLAVRMANDGDGGSWAVDYPRADQNLPTRLSEQTKAPVHMDESGTPHHVVITATEPALFSCPLVMLTNPGRALLTEEDAAALRTYLLKGGFLWADDSWGSRAWDHWRRELRKVLPAAEYRLLDLPISHPLFHTMFDATRIPQIPNIGFFYGTGTTSERGADSVTPHAYGIVDAHERLMVLTTHNTDFGDAYEREAEDPEFFYRFSVEGYAVGINVLLYVMTH